MTAASSLLDKLPTLVPKRHICVLGAAVIDQILTVPTLPFRGADIEASNSLSVIGGCGLNITSTLHRLGFYSTNAFLIGNGMGFDQISQFLRTRGIESHLAQIDGDNSWCLAFVEPDGERSFVTVTGVENDWTPEILRQVDIQADSLIFLSGYQLVSSADETIVSWLESLGPNVEIVIDFGPRIGDVPPEIVARLLALNSIVTLNRDEARFLGIDDPLEQSTATWSERHDCTLIVRRDKEGAYYYRSNDYAGWVEPYAASVVDTIGAGDSHAGGLLAGLSSNWSLVDSIRLGNAVASYIVERPGGDCAPDLTELRQHLSQCPNP